MLDHYLGELESTHPWQAQILRLTAFRRPSVQVSQEEDQAAHQNWWRLVTGEDPEIHTARPRAAGFQDTGPFNHGMLILAVEPNRIDWRLVPRPDDDRPEWPTLGPLFRAIPEFLRVSDTWLPLAPPLERLAVGVVAHMPAENYAEAYQRLSSFLPKVALDDPNARDLSYQINRPRLARTVPELRLNRLAKWSAILAQFVLVGMTSRPMIQELPVVHSRTLCQLELDVNSALDFEEFPGSNSTALLFRELVELAAEIAVRGDIP